VIRCTPDILLVNPLGITQDNNVLQPEQYAAGEQILHQILSLNRPISEISEKLLSIESND